MADNITFLTMPETWLVPGARMEIDHSKAVRGLKTMPHMMLAIGQRLATGTVPAGTVVDITRKGDGTQYFGRGSILAQMCDAALKVNPFTRFKAIALDDSGAGVQAAGTITFGGAPSESGTNYLRVGFRPVESLVTAGNTAAQVATACAAAINADLDGAVTAAAVGAVVTLTSRHKGVEGNNIDIRLNYYQGQFTPKGLTAVIVAMAGGTGNPDVTNTIAALSSLAPYTILSGLADASNLTLLEAELETRWGGMQMRQGHVFCAASGTFSALSAIGQARNSKQTSIVGLKKCPTLPWVSAAQLGAAVEMRGAGDPALPYKSISLPDIAAPAQVDQFTEPERNLLYQDGLSQVIFDAAGNCTVEQVLTTYKTNTYGLIDISLRKLNTKWTADYMRFLFAADIIADYPNHKLAGDDVEDLIAPGQMIATPKRIRNTLIGTAKKLVRVGLMEDLPQFIRELIVVRSEVDPNRVNAILPPNTVNQFDTFMGSLQYVL